MIFELFNRDTVVIGQAPSRPLVQVDTAGRLLLNQETWLFMYQPATEVEVSLLFDRETRRAAIRPENGPAAAGAGASTRWQVHQMRGDRWPKSVIARLFVEHYKIAPGEYQALLLRGPGPRMVTFDVGPPGSIPRPGEALADGRPGG